MENRTTPEPADGSRRQAALVMAGLIAAGVIAVAPFVVEELRGPSPGDASAGQVAPAMTRTLAAIGDVESAGRMIRDEGGAPNGAPALVGKVSVTSGDYALWSYEGKAGNELALFASKHPLGDVHGSCEEAADDVLAICGAGVDTSSAPIIAIGTAPKGTVAVEIELTDGSRTRAVVGEGAWFALLPGFTSEGAPSAPAKVVARGSFGTTSSDADMIVAQISAADRAAG